MLDLQDRYIVANNQGEYLELPNSVDYLSTLKGEWFYVVGGATIALEELQHYITKATKAYAKYEPAF